MVYVFYWCAKESSKARAKSKLKHPTDWEKMLERERRKKENVTSFVVALAYVYIWAFKERQSYYRKISEKEERPYYISNEELKKINDLAKLAGEETGNDELWKVISYVELTGARLKEAIKAVECDKITYEQVTEFLQKQGRKAHDLRQKWMFHAVLINAHPQVAGKLLGHKFSKITVDDEEEK